MSEYSIPLMARKEHYFQTDEDRDHLLCHECHRVFQSGEQYYRFIVGHPYMISGDYCKACSEMLGKVGS